MKKGFRDEREKVLEINMRKVLEINRKKASEISMKKGFKKISIKSIFINYMK